MSNRSSSLGVFLLILFVYSIPLFASAEIRNSTVQSASSTPLARNLSIGMSGDDVFLLQKFLIAAATSSSVTASGKFDAATESAVVSFKRTHGLPISGKVGPRTRALINGILFLSDGDLDRVHTVETSFPSVPGVSYVRVLVGFSHTPQVAEIGLMQKNSGVIKYIYHLVPAIAAQIPKNNLYALLKEPLVKVVEPDRNAFKRDDFDYSWPLNVMHVQPLQNLGFTGKNVRVAILDTGVDYTHPDIAHAYAGGHDFVHNTDTPMDDNGHGTHVAGIIVGPSSTTTSEGVAPDIRLYALKVLNAEGSGMFSDIIAGLEWAVDHHMQIANESFGTSEDPGMIVRDAFQNANDAGLLSIVAAGNDGSCALYAPATTARTNTVEYPGRFPSTIAVAAVDINGNHACFSSSGPDVELAAPGFVIKSAKNGGGWSLKSGTSSAAPYVTGIAALILSAGLSDTNGDGRVNDELRVVLDGSVKSRGGGRTPMYGYGVLDASKAVSLLSAPNTANNP